MSAHQDTIANVHVNKPVNDKTIGSHRALLICVIMIMLLGMTVRLTEVKEVECRYVNCTVVADVCGFDSECYTANAEYEYIYRDTINSFTVPLIDKTNYETAAQKCQDLSCSEIPFICYYEYPTRILDIMYIYIHS